MSGSSVNNIQHGGTHYKDKAVQPWDYIVGNNLGYLEGNIVKYVSRWRDKGGIQDLQKARSWGLRNTAINRLLWTPQGLQLVAWADERHLDTGVRDEHSA